MVHNRRRFCLLTRTDPCVTLMVSFIPGVSQSTSSELHNSLTKFPVASGNCRLLPEVNIKDYENKMNIC